MEEENTSKKGLIAALASSAVDTPKMPVNRLALLSDIIFASSMTLMVIFLDFPDKDTIHSGQDFIDYYSTRDSGIFNFLISFVIVAVYWFKHLERFSYYNSTDQNHLYLEILFLACLVLVPIANTLTTIFPGISNVQVFYSLVMFFLGIFAHFGWQYATKNHRLVDQDLENKVIVYIRHETLVEPAVAVLAIFMAFIYPILWDYTLMLIPLAFVIQKKFTSKKLKA